VTAGGVAAVARQEVLRRVRRGRWRVVLAIWFVVLAGLLALLRLALDAGDADDLGLPMFGALQLLVLALALLVAPAVAAQSINGDRERGVLATLQVTRLTAGDIAVGKFAAAWGALLVFLAVTLPLIVWCVLEGGVSAAAVAVTTAVTALLLGVVCALSLGLSALLARSTTSAVASYLVVFGLTIGSPIAFALATAVAPRATVTETFPGPLAIPPGQTPPPPSTHTYEVLDTSRTWPVLAVNPFVVLADSAPVAPPDDRDDNVDPLAALQQAFRGARQPQAFVQVGPSTVERAAPRPLWPVGLGINVALGAAALALAVRRLRTPSARLARGQRVA